jgi:hypothetical protein
MQRLRWDASDWYRCCGSLLYIGPSLPKPQHAVRSSLENLHDLEVASLDDQMQLAVTV